MNLFFNHVTLGTQLFYGRLLIRIDPTCSLSPYICALIALRFIRSIFFTLPFEFSSDENLVVILMVYSLGKSSLGNVAVLGSKALVF